MAKVYEAIDNAINRIYYVAMKKYEFYELGGNYVTENGISVFLYIAFAILLLLSIVFFVSIIIRITENNKTINNPAPNKKDSTINTQIVCPKCGTKVNSNDNFCLSCGNALTSKAKPQPYELVGNIVLSIFAVCSLVGSILILNVANQKKLNENENIALGYGNRSDMVGPELSYTIENYVSVKIEIYCNDKYSSVYGIYFAYDSKNELLEQNSFTFSDCKKYSIYSDEILNIVDIAVDKISYVKASITSFH